MSSVYYVSMQWAYKFIWNDQHEEHRFANTWHYSAPEADPEIDMEHIADAMKDFWRPKLRAMFGDHAIMFRISIIRTNIEPNAQYTKDYAPQSVGAFTPAFYCPLLCVLMFREATDEHGTVRGHMYLWAGGGYSTADKRDGQEVARDTESDPLCTIRDAISESITVDGHELVPVLRARNPDRWAGPVSSTGWWKKYAVRRSRRSALLPP